MNRVLSCSFLFLIAFSISSCATVFGRWNNTLVFKSPQFQAADVYLDGVPIGKAPGKIKLDPRQIQHGSELRLEADGHEPLEIILRREASAGYIIADVLATAGVALVIDFADGYIYRPKPRRIVYVLEKNN